MNRQEKAAAIAEIATQITEAQAVIAVDPTGLSVAQAAEIRTQLLGADARLRIVKNTLTERAADEAGVAELKELLTGPTALTFVRGDAAAAAKALSDYAKTTDLLPFKGGYMDGAAIGVDELKAIAKLPSRQVLYGQLVGMVAAPLTGLARGLNALLSGVAIALGQVHAKAESGEITLGGGTGTQPAEPAGMDESAAAEEAPAEDAPAAEVEAPAEEPTAETTDTQPTASAGTGDTAAEAPESTEASEAPAEGADDTTDNKEESE